MTSSLGAWAEGPTHQSQKAADLLDGADAAQEAHEHGDGAHADEDVGAHIECVGGGLCGETGGMHGWQSRTPLCMYSGVAAQDPALSFTPGKSQAPVEPIADPIFSTPCLPQFPLYPLFLPVEVLLGSSLPCP